jgi:alpha-D-ribose 1-methylphosphonate 5-triphosphate synthase subunit PhnI
MAGTGQRGSGRPGTGSRIRAVHCDTIQAPGFLEHIKLPHYVDFQSELELVRRLRASAGEAGAKGDTT